MKDNKDIQSQAEPYIVKSHDIHIDADYADWIADIKSRYRSAQVKAAVKVNAEKLLFNWQLGRDLVQKKAEERWGAGVVEQVSLDLKREFPNADGFSVRNLWYMKQWYLFYTQGEEAILHQAGAELQRIENQYMTKMHQLGAELSSEKEFDRSSTVQVPSNYRPSSVQVEKLVQLMHDEYLNVSKMMELCGIKHRMTFRDNYINPALSDGSIERKYPDQPNHPKQMYRLTEQAKVWKLNNID